MKETRAGTATVLAAEQDAASGAPRDTSEKRSHGGALFVIAGIILLLLGG